jgi:outer membrane receptor protein involved in Fe transport
VAEFAKEEPGLGVQRTSPTVAAVYVRGLTGAKVNVFVDGVRYSTSAARGGINTFFDLVEATSLDSVEVLRGPSGAQYGSDALGGSVQFLTIAAIRADRGAAFRGSWGQTFDSADLSFGSHASVSMGTDRFGIVTNLAGRRSSSLRPGQGMDSHAAVTRFLGLPSRVLETERVTDTAFTQYSGLTKINWLPRPDSSVIASYARSQQDGGKRRDQTLGGDGNLIADLRNLMGDFFYLRYDQLGLPAISSLTAMYSFNAQREERVNQGGNGNPLAAINHEYEKTTVQGVQLFGTRQWPSNLLLLGGEYYHERLDSPSFGVDPVTRLSAPRRPRIPDQALFKSSGLYAQDIVDLFSRRFRVIGNIRYSEASYRQRAAYSPIVNGQPLWPDDSAQVSSVSYRAGAVWAPVDPLSFAVNFGRGFRAPSMTDLGTLGLTGVGFEVSAPEVAGRGATIGTTAGADAVSTGRPVDQVRPETSQSYDLSARVRTRRFQTAFTAFINDIFGEIVRQSLILPPGAVGSSIGGEPITAQNANGVVYVAASSNPVLARINFGDSRFKGFEHNLEWRIGSRWTVRTLYTFLRGVDKGTGQPPNIEGSLPASDGYALLRYAANSSRWWIEPFVHFAERLDRISSLALEDRRTGATRTRGSIGNFFRNGARVRGLISPGGDGIVGTADDVLTPTGETLLQVQDRVLGAGNNSAPLFTALPGYCTLNLRGGWRVSERHEIMATLDNIGDRNYRGVSWGVDAPGRSFSLYYRARF